jgi:hypothetical protein
MNLRKERIHEAGKAGIRGRLATQFHVPERRIEDLLIAWDHEAATREIRPGDSRYWGDAEAWLMPRLRHAAGNHREP